MKKICYLGNVQSIHLRKFANHFSKNDWEVHVITWRRLKDLSSLNSNIIVHYINFPPHKVFKLGSALEINKIINKIKPDILHAHYIKTFGAVLGLYLSLFGHVPTILSAWGRQNLIESKFIHKKLVTNAIVKADIIHIDGELMKPVLKNLGASDEKIRLIHYGTNITKFNPSLNNMDICMKFGLKNGPVVISIRNLYPIYDIETLIRAVPNVLNEISNVNFVIAGSGPDEKKLTDLIFQLDIAANVKLIGSIDHNKLPCYLASSDIYISTSLSDAGLSASTAEAMACGLPVIITDFGDNSLWVKNDKNGFIIPLKNPDVLAQKIIQLVKNPELRLTCGQKNREIIEKYSNFEIEMQKFESVYDILIK